MSQLTTTNTTTNTSNDQQELDITISSISSMIASTAQTPDSEMDFSHVTNNPPFDPPQPAVDPLLDDQPDIQQVIPIVSRIADSPSAQSSASTYEIDLQDDQEEGNDHCDHVSEGRGDGNDLMDEDHVHSTVEHSSEDETPTSATLMLSLKELLSVNIAKQILDSTDARNKMIKDTVEKKLMLYRTNSQAVRRCNGQQVEGQVKRNFRKVNLSLPEAYSMKLKSDMGLMVAIYRLICEIVDSSRELALPKLDIELLRDLICEAQVLDGMSKCSLIEIPFTSQTPDKISKLLPAIVKKLNSLLKPSCISWKPDSSALKLIVKPFSPLKTALKKEISADEAPSLQVTYETTTIFGKASTRVGKRKRKTKAEAHGVPAAKKRKKSDSTSKKPHKLELCTVPDKSSIKFTFDSYQPQHNFCSSLFTAYDYWQLETVHKLQGVTMGEGTTIAIVDSGIDPSHPAFNVECLRPPFVMPPDEVEGKVIHFEDLTHGDCNPSPNNHGTMCAGIAAGGSFEYTVNLQEDIYDKRVHPPGVAPRANLVIFKIQMHGEENVSWQQVYGALKKILDMQLNSNNFLKINVVSLSLGSLQFVPEIAQVINELVSNNIIVVCAASNFGHKFSQPISFPARLGNVLCIGSHGVHGKPSNFSPVGQQIDFLAPGADIAASASSHWGHHFCVNSGTSFATPAVAGLICLILGYIKKHCLPEDFNRFQNQWVMKEVLREMSTSPGRHSDDQGFGALNPLQFFRQPTSILNSVLNNIF